MRGHLLALMVHHQPEPFRTLRKTLSELSVETFSVETCEEAQGMISLCRPHVVFAEPSLPDGSWQSLVNLAQNAEVPLNVIVVENFPNTRSYVSVMECGAFDFVVPPFEHAPLEFIVRSAFLDANRRRETPLFAASIERFALGRAQGQHRTVRAV